jgi:hypothetical protein
MNFYMKEARTGILAVDGTVKPIFVTAREHPFMNLLFRPSSGRKKAGESSIPGGKRGLF